MKFVRAFHKVDFDGTQQTIGVDPHGQIWLMTGKTDASEHGGHAYAQFAPAEAVRFADQMKRLAVEGMLLARESQSAEHDPLSGYERFPLRTEWGYNRYQDLAAAMSPKQAMAQASQEETMTFLCSKCGKPLQLFDDGIWTSGDAEECEHEPAINHGTENSEL